MSDVGPLHQLDRTLLADSLERLHQRIAARFPDQHLTELAGAIKESVPERHARFEATTKRLATITRWANAASVLFVVVVGGAVVLALADFSRSSHDGADWLSLVNTVVGDLVYAAIAVAFLRAVPERLTRSTLTKVLHELRSIAHVIDMHQMAKDPERLRDDYEATGASVHPHLPHKDSASARRADLHHYLTYCIELLGLVSKSAALCAENSGDPVVLSMVNDVEQLTSDMSQKIFQKLALLPKDA